MWVCLLVEKLEENSELNENWTMSMEKEFWTCLNQKPDFKAVVQYTLQKQSLSFSPLPLFCPCCCSYTNPYIVLVEHLQSNKVGSLIQLKI